MKRATLTEAVGTIVKGTELRSRKKETLQKRESKHVTKPRGPEAGMARLAWKRYKREKKAEASGSREEAGGQSWCCLGERHDWLLPPCPSS